MTSDPNSPENGPGRVCHRAEFTRRVLVSWKHYLAFYLYTFHIPMVILSGFIYYLSCKLYVVPYFCTQNMFQRDSALQQNIEHALRNMYPVHSKI